MSNPSTVKSSASKQSQLMKVLEATQKARSEKQLPIFRDLDSFGQALQDLSASFKADYAAHQKQASDASARRKRFKAVTSAAKALQLALSELSQDDLRALECEQSTAFSEHFNAQFEDGSESPYYLEDLYDAWSEPYGARSAKRMQLFQDLLWMSAGATALIKPRKQGRQENSSVHVAAQKFVVLCHEHSWTPLTVSHSGTERSDGQLVPSDALTCLAAVFESAGVPTSLSESYARTSLRRLRKEFIFHLKYPADEQYDFDDYSSFNRYYVSLQQMESDFSRHFPKFNFAPKKS